MSDHAAVGEPTCSHRRGRRPAPPPSPRCGLAPLGTGSRSFRLGRRLLYRCGELQAWSNVYDHHDGPDAA
jgi:hypothetical protein